MRLTLDQVKQVVAMQLTPDEVLTLKLVANTDIVMTAAVLEVSKQHVSQTVIRAHNKLKVQGLMPEDISA